jgi:hypothetical protein
MITSHPGLENATTICDGAVRDILKTAISAILSILPDATIIITVETACPISGCRVETFAVNHGATPAQIVALLYRTGSFIRRIFWTDQPLHAQPKGQPCRVATRVLH